MTEIILTLAGGALGVGLALVQGLAILAGVLVVGFIGSQVLNWLFDWAMGKD